MDREKYTGLNSFQRVSTTFSILKKNKKGNLDSQESLSFQSAYAIAKRSNFCKKITGYVDTTYSEKFKDVFVFVAEAGYVDHCWIGVHKLSGKCGEIPSTLLDSSVKEGKIIKIENMNV